MFYHNSYVDNTKLINRNFEIERIELEKLKDIDEINISNPHFPSENIHPRRHIFPTEQKKKFNIFFIIL